MALVRQPRKRNMLQQEPIVETSLGPQLLTELQGVAGQVRDLRTMLFGVGDPAAPETAQGRLSRQDSRIDAVEKKAETNERDIGELKGRINNAQVSAAAYWSFARVVWAFIAAFIVALVGGGFEALITWVLLRR